MAVQQKARPRWRALLPDVSAAPHLPAGILSPYSDGERALSSTVSPITVVANCNRCKKGARAAASPFLPVTIRGEGASRPMRGGAGIDNRLQ
ncbi:hypothetical protein FJ963_00900 [Mesorhizobium sp. B2-1-4]|nr:hypothetical protein FJ962_02475 [Mesorhizobium sp. B2-1-9]TPM89293.1 hypothetical protein FJ963_00900 [Mesorhizobium sp. B2-1-4]